MSDAGFKLSENFINKYKKKTPSFGFNGLGEFIFYRTYSRVKEDKTNEQWWETVRRVVEGTYELQRRWIESNQLGWNPWKAAHSAQEMYDKIFNMKFTPPGRGLWMAGTPYVMERDVTFGLFNCVFISTEYIDKDFTQPFCFMADVSMLGAGCGFDTRGAGKVVIKGFDSTQKSSAFVVPDSRGGWVESIKVLLNNIVNYKEPVEFDYSKVRPGGEPIKGFGGITSGPGPLIELHKNIIDIYSRNEGMPITITTIVDTMNAIGRCVVSGNIRRSSQISFGPADNEEYLDLKNYKINPERQIWGWSSNNSVFAKTGMDYTEIAERIKINGEPGLIWLDNARNFGRMIDPPNYKDAPKGGSSGIMGTNPCGEVGLHHGETCNLVETYPAKHDSLEDYLKTIKYAYLYSKTITLVKTHWPETNKSMLKNRRIGLSMSGIAQFLAKHGVSEFKRWCDEAYKEVQRLDEIYSDWFAIPRSIKTTTTKPSGSVSLVTGSTPGIHFPESRFYIRRVRVAKNSPLLKPLRDANYHIEEASEDPEYTAVVEFPIDMGAGVRSAKDVSMWEQLELAALVQTYWADNSVSITVTFDPDTEASQIPNALDYFQYKLKTVSFLPRHSGGAYKQMPYESITEEVYNERIKNLKRPNYKKLKEAEAVGELYCENDTCEIPIRDTAND